ncbi:MAG: rhombosortase [Candidatus Mariimomonas ferrooxydans]
MVEVVWSIGDRCLLYGMSLDVFVFIILLFFSNIYLLKGDFNNALVFSPSLVRSGEWWRIFTHPFVHVSWYHLLLDAGAFFLLYKELEHEKIIKKLFYVVVCALFSLIAALFASPVIYTSGLCGLSGIAHGLMAVSALEMMRQKKNFRMGLIFFLLVVTKSIYETVQGDVLFSFLHMGLCGTPLAVCHAGGVLGGIAAYSFLQGRRFLTVCF